MTDRLAGRPTKRDAAEAVSRALTRMFNNGTRLRLTKGQKRHIKDRLRYPRAIAKCETCPGGCGFRCPVPTDVWNAYVEGKS